MLYILSMRPRLLYTGILSTTFYQLYWTVSVIRNLHNTLDVKLDEFIYTTYTKGQIMPMWLHPKSIYYMIYYTPMNGSYTANDS